jgi:hypothetical protein
MSECVRRYALDWRFVGGKWLEETDNTFTDASLFSLFMYNGILRIEVEYLAVGELFLCWFLRLRGQARINNEDGANRYLAQQFTLLLQYLLRHLINTFD